MSDTRLTVLDLGAAIRDDATRSDAAESIREEYQRQEHIAERIARGDIPRLDSRRVA